MIKKAAGYDLPLHFTCSYAIFYGERDTANVLMAKRSCPTANQPVPPYPTALRQFKKALDSENHMNSASKSSMAKDKSR